MARVQYVRKAQQRYRTVPVLNEDGSQKTVPVMGRNGEQKVTKTGRKVFRKITVEDPAQPLPNRHCDKCSVEIIPGMPYKWVAVKTSTYGSVKKVRCSVCPAWQPWELSQSLSARLQQIDAQARDGLHVEDPDSVSDALRSAAESVREIANEKSESADNVEEGFGHETELSAELRDIAEQLESWADELETAADEASQIEVGDEYIDCPQGCDAGQVENPEYEEGDDEEQYVDCDECNGEGEIENDERQDALNELEEKLEVLDNCPV